MKDAEVEEVLGEASRSSPVLPISVTVKSPPLAVLVGARPIVA